MALDLPDHVLRAIKCGPIPTIREIGTVIFAPDGSVERVEPADSIVGNPKTDGERVVAFAHRYLRQPDGPHVGEPMVLDVFQIAWLLAVFDNPAGTRDAYLSIARRNGKTYLIAVVNLAYVVGPMARKNTELASAAMSREQAGLVYTMMARMLEMSPQLEGTYIITPSAKRIRGLRLNVDFMPVSSEAKTGHGRSLQLVLLDEAGQIDAPSTPFTEMLRTSQGSVEAPLFITISTQAPNDAAYFSVMLDAAETSQNPQIVSHVYAADAGADLMDETQWQRANPGLGKFRSRDDLAAQLRTAQAIPTQSAGAQNLLLNMRVSQNTLFMSPAVWKLNQRPPNLISRATASLHLGLDLSLRTDLTAAVASWRDEESGDVNLEVHAFAPLLGVKERELRDRAPYTTWAAQGLLQLTPGQQVDYKWVAAYLAKVYAGFNIASVHYDRWRIEIFQGAAQQTPFFGMVERWEPVGQGYTSMAPRLEAFEGEALAGRLRTGGHPVLNLGAASAITVQDPAGNRKLDKSKSTQRIDALVAAVMAVFPVSEGYQATQAFDPAALIG
jgi:phage terminase large subunit-like protein